MTLAFAVNRWLTLRAGLGVGLVLVLDTSASSLSSAELALPVSATLFRTIELSYPADARRTTL